MSLFGGGEDVLVYAKNKLQQFEALVAERAGCLGPLDLLMELATRCRGNVWNAGSHHLSHPGGRGVGR